MRWRAAIIPSPGKPSFTRDILPIFQHLANLEWVNAGFFVQFGFLAPYHSLRPDLLARLAAAGDEFQELRNQILYMFRNPNAADLRALAVAADIRRRAQAGAGGSDEPAQRSVSDRDPVRVPGQLEERQLRRGLRSQL